MFSLQKHSLVLWVALVLAAGAQPVVAQQGDLLVGTWDLIGFTDGGVAAATTGTTVFRSDSTFSIVGTIAFPGEPTDAIAVDGTYEQTDNLVVLTIAQAPSTWTLQFTDDLVVLTQVEPPPANTITLRRQSTPTAPLSWGRLKALFR